MSSSIFCAGSWRDLTVPMLSAPRGGPAGWHVMVCKQIPGVPAAALWAQTGSVTFGELADGHHLGCVRCRDPLSELITAAQLDAAYPVRNLLLVAAGSGARPEGTVFARSLIEWASPLAAEVPSAGPFVSTLVVSPRMALALRKGTVRRAYGDAVRIPAPAPTSGTTPVEAGWMAEGFVVGALGPEPARAELTPLWLAKEVEAVIVAAARFGVVGWSPSRCRLAGAVLAAVSSTSSARWDTEESAAEVCDVVGALDDGAVDGLVAAGVAAVAALRLPVGGPEEFLGMVAALGG